METEKLISASFKNIVLALREAFDLNIEKRDDNGDIYCLSNQQTEGYHLI